MQTSNILDAKAMSFYPSVMCQTCLPVQSVSGTQYYRKVKDPPLNIMVPAQAREEQRALGIPFGIYARGILWFIAQEVTKLKRTEQKNPRHIIIGESLTEAVEEITGKQHTSGGDTSPRGLLDRQLYWLSHAHISFRKGNDGRKSTNMSFASSYEQTPLWRPHLVGKGSNQPREVSLVLNHEFYSDLVAHSVPLDKRVMKCLWGSPLQMDLYVWLTRRANDIAKKPGQRADEAWDDIMDQFGENYAKVDGEYAKSSIRRFRYEFHRAFQIVRQVYNPDDLEYVKLDEVGNKLWITAKGPSVPSDAVMQFNRRQFAAQSAHIPSRRRFAGESQPPLF